MIIYFNIFKYTSLFQSTRYIFDTVPDTGGLPLVGAALAARGKGSGRGFLTLPIVRLLYHHSFKRVVGKKGHRVSSASLSSVSPLSASSVCSSSVSSSSYSSKSYSSRLSVPFAASFFGLITLK